MPHVNVIKLGPKVDFHQIADLRDGSNCHIRVDGAKGPLAIVLGEQADSANVGLPIITLYSEDGQFTLTERHFQPFYGSTLHLHVYEYDPADRGAPGQLRAYGVLTLDVGSNPAPPQPPSFDLSPKVISEPDILGTFEVGQTLQVQPGSYSGHTSLTRAWLRDGVVIAGAAGATYPLTAADLGAMIDVRETASNKFDEITATSPAYGPVATARLNAPTVMKAPSVAGTATEGETLSADEGTFTGAPTITLQWLRGSTAISGATGASYVLQAADVGSTISVRATADNGIPPAAVATSTPTGIVAALPDVPDDPDVPLSNTAIPVISGTPTLGNTLSASQGTWAGSEPRTFSYQWTRDGADIAGATSSTYLLRDADANTSVGCDVTAHDGFTDVTASAVAFSVAGDAPTTETVVMSMGGITATYDGATASGTYANGEPWVANGGAAGAFTAQSPAGVLATRTLSDGTQVNSVPSHGAEIDPGKAASGTTLAERQAANDGLVPTNQGYDGLDDVVATDGSDVGVNNLAYDAALNVSGDYPLALSEGSLVVAKSNLTNIHNQVRPGLDALGVFTVVPAAPAAGDFRPGVSDPDKAPMLNASDFDLTKLRNLDGTGYAIPSADYVLGWLRFETWQHTYNALSRNIVPGDPVYGGDRTVWTEAMVWVHFDAWTAAEKRAICYALAQHAIDLTARAEQGGIWQENGGHCAGLMGVVAFTAWLTGNARMLAALKFKTDRFSADGQAHSIWGSEGRQFFYISQSDVDFEQDFPYTVDQIGQAEWGSDNTRDTFVPNFYRSNSLAVETPAEHKQHYRHIIAKVNVPTALAATLGGWRSLLPQAMLDYQDRHMDARIAAAGPLPQGDANDVSDDIVSAWQEYRESVPYVAAVIGQSENEVGWATNGNYYVAGPYPALVPGVDAQIAMQASSDTSGADTIRTLDQAAVDNKNVSPGFVAMANLWHVGSGGRALRITDVVVPGTGMNQLLDEDDGGRDTSGDISIIAAAQAEFGPISSVTYNWWNAEASPAKTLWESRSAHFFGVNPDGTDYDFAAGSLEHCIIDITGRGFGLFQDNAKLNLMLPGQRVETTTALYSEPHINYRTRSDGSEIYGMIDQNAVPAVQERKDFLADAPAVNRGLATITPAVSRFGDYSGGVQLPAPAQTGIHPAMQSEDGQQLFSQHVAMSFLISEGYFRVPRCIRKEFAPDGSFMDFVFEMPNGGDLSTTRKVRGGSVASPRPHQQLDGMGVVIYRAGDTDRTARPLFRLGEPDAAPAYRGTVAIHDAGSDNGDTREAILRVTPEVPFADDDAVHFGTDGGYGVFLLYGYPDYDAYMYLDALIEHVPSLYSGAQYPGIPVEPQVIAIASDTAPEPDPAAWNVSGGIRQITVTSAPDVTAPTATGGVQQITVTE